MGWSDDDGRTLINGLRYNVNETYGDSIVLVGIWKDKRVYTLTLDNLYSDGDVQANIQKLYYKPAATYKYEYSSESGKQERGEIEQSEGWYRDVDCVTPFTGFSEEEKPKRKPAIRKFDQIVCPKCENGHVIKGRTAFGCSEFRKGCDFRVGFDELKSGEGTTPSALNKYIEKKYKKDGKI